MNCTGRVVVMGIGKSGHIARKFASTLASTTFNPQKRIKNKTV